MRNAFSTKSEVGKVYTIATQSYDGTTYSFLDASDTTIGSSDALAQCAANSMSATILRDSDFVDAAVIVTITATLTTRLLQGGYLQVKIPTDQLVLNGETPLYTPDGGT